jgi:hypothetical protein
MYQYVRIPTKTSIKPLFGCRNLLILSNQALNDTDLLGPLETWDNCLKHQSIVRGPNWIEQKKRYCDSLGNEAHPSNPDGFGMLVSTNNGDTKATATIYRTNNPLHHPEVLQVARTTINEIHPNFLMAHIREKSDRNAPSIENTHPFTLDVSMSDETGTGNSVLKLCMLHNGAVEDGIQHKNIQTLLAQLPKQEPGLLPTHPKSTTDTEQLLHLIVVKLREVLQKDSDKPLSAKELTPQVLQQAVAKTIMDVAQYCEPFPHYNQIKFPGRMIPPGFNIMLAIQLPQTQHDAPPKKMVIITRKGRPLYKNFTEAPDGPVGLRKTLLIASEKMHPHGETLTWDAVKEGTAITILEDPKRKRYQISEAPLSQLANGVPSRFDWTV